MVKMEEKRTIEDIMKELAKVYIELGKLLFEIDRIVDKMVKKRKTT
jgi:hypothetical protein